MKIFIQGMRRSATTFLYDILCADGRFDAYYEPLAAADRPAIGGGSRVSKEDYFEKIRQVRKAYAQASELKDLSVLNWGAPRDARLEIGNVMDKRVVGYLSFLLERADHTLLKFVRAYDKVHLLHELCPDAYLLHIVRDPRAVASSFLLGKGQIHRSYISSGDRFFDFRADRKNNAGGPRSLQAVEVADFLIAKGMLTCEADAAAYEKILAVWAYHFRNTHRDGQAAFGLRYRLVQYEELQRRPEETLRGIYAILGEECSAASLRWLQENLADRPQVFNQDDSRWTRSLEGLQLGPDLEAAGYQMNRFHPSLS